MKRFILLVVAVAAVVYGYFWYVRDIELVSYLRRLPTGEPITYSYSDAALVDSSEDRWLEAPPLTEARTSLAAATVGEDIYAIGGLNGFGRVSDRVDIFNVRGGTWRTGPSLPQPVHSATAIALDGKIYLIGGMNRLGSATIDTVLVLDVAHGYWQPGPPLPRNLSNSVAVVLGGQIHLFGGRNSIGPVATHYYYDTATDRWETAEELLSPRYALSAAVSGDRVYVVGGRSDSTGGDLSDFDTLNIKENAWDALVRLPNRRGGLRAGFHGQRLYVFGGELVNKVSNRLDVYDLASGSWQAGPSLPRALRDFGLAQFNGYFFLIGGSPRGNYSVSGQVFVFLPKKPAADVKVSE